jgi:hypothetical protein
MTERKRSFLRIAIGAGVALVIGLGLTALQAQSPPQKPPAKKDPAARMTEAWPDAGQVAEHRAAAENLPLFRSREPLAFTLTADFPAINRDRNPNSTKTFPGVLEIQGDGGSVRSIPLQLAARGHARRNPRVCSVVPLRLDFAKKDVAGTVFEGQGELKLVTNCEDESVYEQYVLTEYLTYRIFNVFTPRSFRARLVRVRYVDPKRNQTPAPRYGVIIEDDKDVARRLEGRLVPLPNRLFSLVDQESLMWLTLLQFMIGNTDYSIMALHNVKLVQDRRSILYPITYDFDYSGLVYARYAVADKRLNLSSVRERMYRGPCKTAQELAPFLETFNAKKDEVLALVDEIPDMKPERRKDARDYLNEFFSIVANPAKSKRALIDKCVKAVGM